MKQLLLALFVLVGAFALGLGSACKSSAPEGAGGDAAVAAAQDGPTIDCKKHDEMAAKCRDALLAEYAKTPAAKRAGQGDGDKGADYLRMGMDAAKEKFCPDQYAIRDPGWRKDFVACESKTDCAEWAACIAPVIGR